MIITVYSFGFNFKIHLLTYFIYYIYREGICGGQLSGVSSLLSRELRSSDLAASTLTH